MIHSHLHYFKLNISVNMAMLLKLLSITLLVFSTQVASFRALEVGQTARLAQQLERSEKDNNTLLSAERSCTFRPELRIDCYPEQGSNQGAHVSSLSSVQISLHSAELTSCKIMHLILSVLIDPSRTRT